MEKTEDVRLQGSGLTVHAWGKGARVFVQVPDLSFVAQGSAVQEAWEKADATIQALYQKYRDAGIVDRFPVGRGRQRKNWPFLDSGAAVFIAKTAVASVALIAAISFAANVAIKSVNRNISDLRIGKVSLAIHELAEDIGSSPLETRQFSKMRAAQSPQSISVESPRTVSLGLPVRPG